MSNVYHDYFYDKTGFDNLDDGYFPLKHPDVVEKPLAIPAALKPDRVDGNNIYYTITVQEGSTQLFQGVPTKTWEYNTDLLRETVVLETGKTYHVTLKNELSEVTTFRWHGLNIVGPFDDGGPHAPVCPHGERKITFTVDQPSATIWLHPHPCPETARQVWNGLATPVVITDKYEQSLHLPSKYGVDDIPVVLQDRSYYNNQLDYKKSYDVDDALGEFEFLLINGTLNPFLEITKPIVRLRLLNGSNRRE